MKKIYRSVAVTGLTLLIPALALDSISIADQIDTGPVKRISIPLALPVLKPEVSDLAALTPIESWKTHKIQSGENLSLIFAREGIDKQVLNQILNSSEAGEKLATVRSGKTMKFLFDNAGQLQKLSYQLNRLDSIEVTRDNKGFEARKHSRPVERRIAHAHAVIHSSLFADAKSAGLTDKTIMDIVNIFSWDIDFAKALNPGDEITVIYERLFIDGEFIASGNVLAVDFINRGKSHTALRFEDENGSTAYYTPDGNSLRRAFLKTPVEFARISSHFNLHRRHPVLNRIRAHKGVDYAAATGTPVRTTGDGTVVFRGRKGGYGRVVIVQHGKKYSTLYAHLSKFSSGASKGAQVSQGQTIGYVGKSGLATGPHLHYEFRIDGRHQNPLTVKLPNTLPLEADKLAEFKSSASILLGQLELYRSTVLLAQAEPPTHRSIP